ncbi:MAG: histidinol-phosphatase [Geminicoccaceae bacterium]|nr:MAG: histidinol-phosphatase [Geminicoccaceae bacterium]
MSAARLREADRALAERLADAAGRAVLPYFRRLDHLDLKADSSPVTAADRAAEQAMRQILAAERPGDGILGEEFEPVAGTGERLWVLDPIDGTKAFVTGKPMFTTLIALVERRIPVLGVIDQPWTRERWFGDGTRATLNGQPIQTRGCTALEAAVLSSTAPGMFQSEAERAALARLQGATAAMSWGGDAYAYGLLAAGCIDLVLETNLQPFDLAALVPVVTGAGGVITDWQGRPLTLDSAGDVLAAGDAALHRQALRTLGGCGTS